MPKGGKKDREVQHIVQSEMARGKSRSQAENIAYGHLANQKKQHNTKKK
jgi:hypothetical protein